MDNAQLIEIALVAFTTFFATIGPVDVAALFAALTQGTAPAQRRGFAFKGVLIATTILMLFAVFGEAALARLGITLAAMRTAGGILLLLIAIDMVFARHSGGSSTTDDETTEAKSKEDISVFPLATPLIAGPGSMGAVVLLSAESAGNLMHWAVTVGALLAVLLITLVLLLMAGQVQKLLGVTGLNVISRVVGVLLAALSVQFMFDGLSASPLFS
ncbi:MarC family protein [Magnetovibrio sp.]|uniref:MarC family protein n=1 Tax=Magnetovibrio sp. TaxID=2024836 RepID=UPI002F91E80E